MARIGTLDFRALTGRWLSPARIAAIAIGLTLIGLVVQKGMQDPDFFFHHATGQYIARTGTIPTTDPFTFTWGGQPWTTHEWLSALGLYWLDVTIGPAGTTLLFGLFPVAIVGVLFVALRSLGVRTMAIAPPAILCGLAIVPYITLRPQAVSWLGVACLVAVLLTLRSVRVATLLIPAFALWANLHGVYVVGLGILAIYTAFTLAGRTPMPRWPMVAIAVACLLATALTPAGPMGLLYPLRYLEPGDWGLANIPEWQSPDFHEPAHWLFIGVIVALILVGVQRSPGWLTVSMLLGLAGALVASRGIPVAAALALPVLALGWPRWSLPHPGVTQVAVLVMAVGAFVVTFPWSLSDSVLGRRAELFPVTALDAVPPDARVFTQAYWGGYVIHRLHDSGGSVFLDGRNDMYDQAILDEYSAAIAGRPGWETTMDRWDVDVIVLPPDYPLAVVADWCPVYRDAVAVVLMREC